MEADAYKVYTPGIMESINLLSPQQAAQVKSNSFLLDVRTPAEFEESHIEGAVLHPLTELDANKVRELASGSARCIVICGSGGRARQAYDRLVHSNVSNLTILEGGMKAWGAAGLPVVRGKKTISLERQVRIAAGSLAFAGITDTCGMAMLLARMPWNTKGARKSACCVTRAGCDSK